MHGYLGGVRRFQILKFPPFSSLPLLQGGMISSGFDSFPYVNSFFFFFLPNRYNLFAPSFGFIFIPIIKMVFGLPTASFQLL